MPSPVKLKVTKRTEKHPKTGEIIQITEFQRGILGKSRKSFKDPLTLFEELASESPRQGLENYCDHLREFLRSRNLPSDRQPLWVQYDGGPWHERQTDTLEYPEPGKTIRSSIWTSRLDELTEELSPERLAGELLWDLIQLLKRPGIDDHLWHIVKYANSYCNFRMCGRFNQLADRGAMARRACASGPAARRAKGIKVGEVVMDCANKHWADNPGNRTVASSTAAAIREDVNNRLRANQMLSNRSNGLSGKTISDYIRKNSRV